MESEKSTAAYIDSLRPAGSKRSSKRDRIIDVFLRQEGHLTADDLVDLIRKEDQRISRATVYRTLAWMEAAGIARKVDFGEGRFRFEHSYRHPRHFHLICKNCNQSMEFLSSDIEQMIEEVAEARKFNVTQAVVQLYGTCEACTTGRPAETKLASTESLFARDALRIAIATERSGQEFYTRASAMTRDARARSVFERLATSEDDHLARLEDRYRQLLEAEPDLESQPQFLFFRGAANGLFSAGVDALRNVTGDKDALMIGIRCERGSHRFFKRYGEKFEDSEGKRVFLEFADEERDHLELLIREYRILSRKDRGKGQGGRVSADVPVVQCTGVIKDYRGLRPLRLLDLHVQAGDRVVLGGIDVIGAEVVTNLINGATLPDQGEVRVFGQATHEIVDGEAWLAGLDRFGIVTARAVLLEGMTVRQNVALPITIEIDPVPDTLVPQVDALAREAGIDDTWFDRMAHEAPVPVRMRIHLARALALSPRLLLLEHPTASLEAVDRPALADDVRRVAETRALTLIACSQDRDFARRVATRHLQLHPGTGALNPMSLLPPSS